jgi:hypothetical protein
LVVVAAAGVLAALEKSVSSRGISYFPESAVKKLEVNFQTGVQKFRGSSQAGVFGEWEGVRQ